jgi:hypothetical protein
MSANVHSGWPLQKNGPSVRPKPISYGGRGSRRLGHDIEMFAGTRTGESGSRRPRSRLPW